MSGAAVYRAKRGIVGRVAPDPARARVLREHVGRVVGGIPAHDGEIGRRVLGRGHGDADAAEHPCQLAGDGAAGEVVRRADGQCNRFAASRDGRARGSGVVGEVGRDRVGDGFPRLPCGRARHDRDGLRPADTVRNRPYQGVAVDRLRDGAAHVGLGDAQLHGPLVAVVGVDRRRAADRLDAFVVSGREPGRDIDAAARERGFERARTGIGTEDDLVERRPRGLVDHGHAHFAVAAGDDSPESAPGCLGVARLGRGREDVEGEHRERAGRGGAGDLHRARIERGGSEAVDDAGRVRPVPVAGAVERCHDVGGGHRLAVGPGRGAQRVDEPATIRRCGPRVGEARHHVEGTGRERGQRRVLELPDLARHRARGSGGIERTDGTDHADREPDRTRGRDRCRRRDRQ